MARVRLSWLLAWALGCGTAEAPPADLGEEAGAGPQAEVRGVPPAVGPDALDPVPYAGGARLRTGGLRMDLDARGAAVVGGSGAWRFEVDGPAVVPEVVDRRVVYRRGSGLTEWYEARANGVEQGFIVSERPAGDLVVRGTVHTDARVERVDGGLAFGELTYAGLRAWDAAGRELEATMEWGEAGRRVSLRIARSALAGARFPVTIDPLLTVPSWQVDPTDQVGSRHGFSVAGVGDVDGDGFEDVVVGAWSWDGEEEHEGRAFLFAGSASGLATTPAWLADPTDARSAAFGHSVAGAGDVNGDGYDDVIVGAPGWYDSTHGYEGRAYVYYGSPTGLPASPSWTADPADQNYARFGHAVASAGDVNGDGYDDVIVGANLWDGSAIGEGRAWVFLGSASGLAATPAWQQDPTNQLGASFGEAVAPAGDVNGDGYDDVVVGAPDWDSTSHNNEGRVYVYHGSATGLATVAGWTAAPTAASGVGFGTALAGAGDVNDDGFDDVAVGVPGWDGPGYVYNEGRVYLFLGGATGLAPPGGWTADPTDQNGARFGSSVALGDVTGDGVDDLIVGAAGFDGAADGEGRAYVYTGSTTGLGVAPAWGTDPTDQPGAGFGVSVSFAGDVGDDGIGDLVVGADYWDGAVADEGRAYAFHGGPIVTKALGEPCGADAECVSGHCVDSVCCDDACGGGDTGDCRACSVASGAGADGTCGTVAAGHTCRAVLGPCDVEETCDGTSTACPSNAYVSAGTECRASEGPCDPAETCSGTSPTCPLDARAVAGTVCRASAGACDEEETCTGSSDACPADAFVPAGTECRAPAGVCDVAESCTGSVAACPADAFASDGTSCADGTTCNGDEACSGGTCVAGTALDCDDGDPCTVDGCGEPAGCVHTPIAGCGVDAGTPDAGPPDAGASDAGSGSDAGPPDAGTSDAGASDAGAGSDAGSPDAGASDAGPPDGGPTDAGSGSDAGGDLDASTSPADAGTSPPDASVTDAGDGAVPADGASADAADPDADVAPPRDRGGCSCRVASPSSGATPLSLAFALALALAIRRRRR